MTGVEAAAVASPYKGLANYAEDDAAIFFGRDREREVIIANLKARRLTLLYGESGVGKSSLLRAGVASRLRELARENVEDLGVPDFIPVVFSSWRDDPVAALAQAIREGVAQSTGERLEALVGQTLEDAIAAATRATDGYLLVILDQFEEYFLYHPQDDGTGFTAQFVRAVNRPGLQAAFLVSIREDALAKIDRFKGDIPNLFDTSLRVSHLDTAAAREAILRPVEYYNGLAAPDQRVAIEPELIEAVLEQVRTGAVLLEEAGQGTLRGADGAPEGADQIETPYLQLVMTRLWECERRERSQLLRRKTLAELGGAQEIIRTHLDAALGSLTPAESDAAADLFHHLVTPSGSKIAHGALDLSEYVHRPEADIQALLEKLASGESRIVRPLPPPLGEHRPPRFEIFHDVLAPSILHWRRGQVAARRAAEQRRAARAATRRRLIRLGVLAGTLAFATVVSLALVANSERRKAERAEALSRELAAFDATLEYRVSRPPAFGNRLLVRKLSIRAPRDARVMVSCTEKRCPPFDATVRGAAMQTIEVLTLRDRPLPAGTRIHVLVTRSNIGKYFRFTVKRDRLDRRLYRCRPRGSRVSPAQVAPRCPDIRGGG